MNSNKKRTLADCLPWPLYRLLVRYRMWRDSGPDLNNRVDVERVLLDAFKTGRGLDAEQCRALGYRLGIPKGLQL